MQNSVLKTNSDWAGFHGITGTYKYIVSNQSINLQAAIIRAPLQAAIIRAPIKGAQAVSTIKSEHLSSRSLYFVWIYGVYGLIMHNSYMYIIYVPVHYILIILIN